MLGRRHTAHSAAVNSTVSRVYAHPYPAQPTRAAPISGPPVSATLNVSVCSALAAGMSRGSSSRGMIAVRAGLLIANAADCRATSPYSRVTDPTSSHAWTAMAAVTSHSTDDASSDTVRRS